MYIIQILNNSKHIPKFTKIDLNTLTKIWKLGHQLNTSQNLKNTYPILSKLSSFIASLCILAKMVSYLVSHDFLSPWSSTFIICIDYIPDGTTKPRFKNSTGQRQTGEFCRIKRRQTTNIDERIGTEIAAKFLLTIAFFSVDVKELFVLSIIGQQSFDFVVQDHQSPRKVATNTDLQSKQKSEQKSKILSFPDIFVDLIYIGQFWSIPIDFIDIFQFYQF